MYYSTQSSSPSKAHGSATSQTASVSSTSQLSTTPSCIYPTISTTTTSVPSSQLAVMSQRMGTSVNMNTMIAAAIA